MCEVHTAMCEVNTAMSEVYTAICVVHSAICEVHTAMCEVHTAMCEVHTAKCEVHKAIPYKHHQAFWTSTVLHKIGPFVGSKALCILSCNKARVATMSVLQNVTP